MWTRVDHQACITPIICAGFDQLEFTTAAFFGWGPEKADSTWLAGLLEGRGYTEKGGEGSGGDQVVAAGVADLGEGVVLGIENDQAAAGAVFGLERGGQTVGGGGDGEAAEAAQGVDEGGVGGEFEVGEFGVGVDVGVDEGDFGLVGLDC